MEGPRPLTQYLGADYKFGEIEVPEVGKVRTCKSSMEDYFKAICDDFVALAKDILRDSRFTLKSVPTPFLDEPQHKAIVRPTWCEGPSFVCPHCQTSLPEEKGAREE